MKKPLFLIVGVALLVGGARYATWWHEAREQFHALARSGTLAQGAFDVPSPLDKALTIIGADLRAPSAEGGAASSATLARSIDRALSTRMVAGGVAAMGGVLLGAAALRMKGARAKPSTTRA